jgi:hypothetical protein
MAKLTNIARLEALERRIDASKPVYIEIIRPGIPTVKLKSPPGCKLVDSVVIYRSYGAKP